MIVPVHPKTAKCCSSDKKFKTRFQGYGPHRIHRMVEDRYDVMEKSFRISLEGIYMYVVSNDETYN